MGENENFQVFFPIGFSTDRDEGKNGGENVLEDGPTHLLCAPKFEVAQFCQPVKAGQELLLLREQCNPLDAIRHI
jgi:hypothetical protein